MRSLCLDVLRLVIVLGSTLSVVAGYSGVASVPERPGLILRPGERLMAGDALLERLRKGGLYIFFRHFHTTREGVNDDLRQFEHGSLELEDFEDLEWQRPLVPYGRTRAEHLGTTLRSLGIPIGRVMSSPYDRVVESARLVTGVEPERRLGLLYRKGEVTREMMEQYQHDILAAPVSDPSRNDFIFGHRAVMDGIGVIAEGEAYVFEPHADGRYDLIGKIEVNEWTEALVNPWYLGREGFAGYTPAFEGSITALHGR